MPMHMPCVSADVSDPRTVQLFNAHDAADVARLVAAGVNIHAVNSAGDTALMVAASRGRLAVVNALLAQGADLQASARDGATALTLAARCGHAAVVEALCAAQSAR